MTDADLTSERVEEWLASIGTVSEVIAWMVWAFPDDGRRELVRALALRVAQIERELEQLRRDAARDLPAPARAARHRRCEVSAPKLTEAQVRMMRAIRDHHDATHGLRGRSEHGAASGTLSALVRRGLVHDGSRLTDAGRAVLAAHEGGCAAFGEEEP